MEKVFTPTIVKQFVFVLSQLSVNQFLHIKNKNISMFSLSGDNQSDVIEALNSTSRSVLDEILNLIESVSEGLFTYTIIECISPST